MFASFKTLLCVLVGLADMLVRTVGMLAQMIVNVGMVMGSIGELVLCVCA